MPLDVLALPGSSLNTKWKEPYASASLNQRMVGIVAPGIYRGLRLVPDPALGDRTVVVEKDPDKLDHVAVYENAAGYSVAYRDATSGDITLSLLAYSNVTVVICLFVNYAPGVSTTGSYRVYTQAEFDVLAAAVKNALVVLGTVVVPVSGAISSSNISLLNRTLASLNLSRGTIPNAPVVRNPGFESGETNATHAKSTLFWDKSITAGTGTWKTSTTQVSTGMKSIEINVTAGPISGEISQQVGVQTEEDELFIISVDLKQLKTISSGTLAFFLEWSDVNDALLTTTTISLDGGGVDSAFRTISTIIPAPAGAASLRSVGVRATLMDPATPGIFGYLDNVDVLVEPRDPSHPYPFDQAFRRAVAATALTLLDKTGNFASQLASLRFDPSTPSGEGRVLAEPGNPANTPPALGWLGRFYKLGSALLATEANALKPRVEADTSIAGSTEFTLMWQSARDGESAGGYTQAVVRTYTSPSGSWVFTANAAFDGTNWIKDVNGQVAYRLTLARDQFVISSQIGGTNTWADAAWVKVSEALPGAVNMLLGTGSNQFVFTPTEMTHDANIIPATSGAFNLGSAAAQMDKTWTRRIGLGADSGGVAPTDLPLGRSLSIIGSLAPYQGEYISKRFGIWARKGVRFWDDFFSETTVPDGWNSGSIGAGASVARDGTIPHTLNAVHTGAANGSSYIYTANSFRLTDGFVARWRLVWNNAGTIGTTGAFGFGDPVGGANGMSFQAIVDNVTSGGPYFGTGFRYGGTLDATFKQPTGGTLIDIDAVSGSGEGAFGSNTLMRWYTLSVVGSNVYWEVFTTEPDGEINDDSLLTAIGGAGPIAVPSGLFPFYVSAPGVSGLGGTTMKLDYFEIVSGGRDGG
jgi:hypothetical protein